MTRGTEGQKERGRERERQSKQEITPREVMQKEKSQSEWGKCAINPAIAHSCGRGCV